MPADMNITSGGKSFKDVRVAFTSTLILSANLCVVEEKYGQHPSNARLTSTKIDGPLETDNSTETSSSSDLEDDDGFLASGILDQQIEATLEAIRSKDPRVYDKRTTFYTDLDADSGGKSELRSPEQKPMYLKDYHRNNILGGVTQLDEDKVQQISYSQEQAELKSAVINEMRVTTHKFGGDQDENTTNNRNTVESEEEEDFLIPKMSGSNEVNEEARKTTAQPILDVETAEQDPEKFLSEFISTRAWISSASSRFQPFLSDDEDEERRADEFEEAYNLRFEDPSTSNEKIMSHARDTAAKYSIRRENTTSRKKARETERKRREAEKKEREDEKARLRKLRIADAEDKIKRIKEAAGLREQSLDARDWSRFLDEGWDDKRWEEEMTKSFGESYYMQADQENSDGDLGVKKRKVKKPSWGTDIDISDIVPDFDMHNPPTKGQFSLSDDEYALQADTYNLHKDSKEKTSHKKEIRLQKNEQQKQARKERRHIERLIDENIATDHSLANIGSKHRNFFRYRETSPTTFGLTAQDILMASDSQLNQYAGLKKLAAYRDIEKKKKDRKRLGKKNRLRQWRKETFGNEQGPQKDFTEIPAGQSVGNDQSVKREEVGNIREVQKRKRRTKREKAVGRAG